MVCGKCGREFAEGVKFCTNCGVELSQQDVKEAVEEAAETIVETAEEAVEEETVTEETAESVGDVEETTEVTVAEEAPEVLEGEVITEDKKSKKKEKNEKKLKDLTETGEKKLSMKIKIALAAVAVLAVILIPIVVLSGKKAFITLSDDSVLDFYKEYGRMYAYLQNGEKVFLDDTEIYSEDVSLDKTTVCYSNENGELVIFKDGKSIKTGIEDAKGVKVSSEGDTFVYFTDCEGASYFNTLFGYEDTKEQGTLHLYFIDKGRDFRIDEDVLVNSAVLSPDGETVAYVADYEATDDFKGYYSVKGKKPVEVGKEKRVFAIANKGEYVYYTDDDRIYAQKKKEAGEKLASDVYGTTVLMNRDCTEMVFLYDGKTYITVKAGEKKKIAGNELNAVVIKNDTVVKSEFSRSDKGTVSVSYTGADTFREKLLYSTVDREIVYLKNDLETERLASDTKQYAVADNKQSLVYIDGMDIVKVTDFANGGVKADLKEDAEARELYAAGDLKYVYYVNRDEELFCIKGNKAKKIADDVTSVTVSPDGKYCYYVVDKEKLCYSKKGKKGKELFEEEDVTIKCEANFGMSVVKISQKDTETAYRMNGKEMEQFYKYEEENLEDYLKEKYNLDEPLDFFLN